MWVAFAKATHIFSAKNIRIMYIESVKTVNEMTLNELVKLTTLWTTGPCSLIRDSSVWINKFRQPPVTHGDWLWKHFYGQSPYSTYSWAISVTGKSKCTSSGLSLRGLSLPRESVSSLIDWLKMTLTLLTRLQNSESDQTADVLPHWSLHWSHVIRLFSVWEAQMGNGTTNTQNITLQLLPFLLQYLTYLQWGDSSTTVFWTGLFSVAGCLVSLYYYYAL